MVQDIRWHQRFANYRKALKKLSDAIGLIKSDYPDLFDEESEMNEEDLDQTEDILREGLIKRFEYTYELAWNVMKDYAEFQGNTEGGGSRDAIREAFKIGLIEEADTWMDMIKSRQLTVHTYNSETADQIFNKIINNYFALFLQFEAKMEALRSGKQAKLS